MTTNHHKRLQTTWKQARKQAQTTTIYHQMTTNHQQTTTNYPQINKNYQQMTTNYQQATTSSHPCRSNQKGDIFFFPHLVITRTIQILKIIGSQWGEITSYFQSTCAEQERWGMVALVGFLASMPFFNKEIQLLFWFHLRGCFFLF